MLTFILCFFCYYSQLFAQSHHGPIALSMGGAGRGAIDPGESVYLNPAVLPHMPGVNSSLIYQEENTDIKSNKKWMLMFSDNTKEVYFPAAFSMSYDKDAMGDVGQDFIFSGGKRIGERISFGLAIHYNIITGESKRWTQSNLHLGFIYAPNPMLGLALVLYDFSKIISDAPKEQLLSPVLAGGLHFLYAEFIRFRFDLKHRLSTELDDRRLIEVMGGVETFFLPSWAMRIGFDNNPYNNKDYFSLGFGWNGPRLCFDYAFQKNTGHSGDYIHSIDLRFPL